MDYSLCTCHKLSDKKKAWFSMCYFILSLNKTKLEKEVQIENCLPKEERQLASFTCDPTQYFLFLMIYKISRVVTGVDIKRITV